jgi:hypothetical protein
VKAAKVAPERLALNMREAAAALGVSEDTFGRYIAGAVPTIYLGRCRLYPVTGLRAWLEREAVRPS